MDIKMLNSELAEKSQELFQDNKIVFGFGLESARLIMVGEAPGANEEQKGRPFVGAAGKNLDYFLLGTGLSRDEIYITNVVKIRPTELSKKTGGKINRAPNRQELDFFKPFLFKEIEIINPQIVVTLGNVPLKAILDDQSASIGEMHARIIHMNNRIIFPLYHPASLIYNRSLKGIYDEDIKLLKNVVDESRH